MTRFFLFGFLTLLFALPSHAQICGPSTTKIYVVDGNGKAVEGAKLEFPDFEFDMDRLYGDWLISSVGTYTIKFSDSKPSGFHRVRVEVPGYVTTDMRIRISEAQMQSFRIVVQPVGSKISNYIEQLFSASGQVRNLDGKAISGSRIIFTNPQKRQFMTSSAADGGYSLELPNDFYSIEVYQSGGPLGAKFDSFRVSDKANSVDVVLNIGRSGFGGSEMVCKPHEIFANEERCLLIARNNSLK